MDQEQYSTLWEAVRGVPDPRRARGKRYSWMMLLSILCAGLASGQRTVWAIASWARLHGQELRALLGMGTGPIPSPATLYRAAQDLDIEALEARLRAYGLGIQQAGGSAGWQSLAVDGKELRGASKHGSPVRLVSLADHQRAIVVGECRVPQGSNELGALPELLQGQPLEGKVLTMDALFTCRALAQQIREQKGHYFMAVKANQPWLYEALEGCFQSPPLPGERRQRCQSDGKAHGRLEHRRVVASDGLNHYLDWPGVQQVVQRTCTRQSSGEATATSHTRYAITSLPAAEAPVERLAALWRGHGVIENRIHYVRDDTRGEDRNQMRRGHGPQTLAALRNGLLTLFRQQGFDSIAEALRTHAARLRWSLESLGIIGSPNPVLQDSSTSGRL